MSKKILSGVVVSNKMEKTIVVNVARTIMHPIYKKFFRTNKKFMAHDEEQVANIGDEVRIEESKPLSKKKRWKLVEVTKKAVSLESTTSGEE